MTRRNFINNTAVFAGLTVLSPSIFASKVLNNRSMGKIMTISGEITPTQSGKILSHEHLFSNFGADPSVAHLFDKEKLFAQVVPYLKKVRSLGCDTIVECTTAYFGRRVDILKELSHKTGINIITNTGYYGAANDKYVPQHAYDDSPEQIAEVWIKEFQEGIAGSDIKPGFIKIGVDNGSLSTIDAKLVKAGAIAHRATGLTLAIHTGNNPESAEKQLEILQTENVHPSAWIWTHANKSPNAEPLISTARKGAWISLDGIRDAESQQHHLHLLQEFRKENLLQQVLLSHDGNGFPSGKEIRPFHTLYTEFIPLLKERGYKDKEIKMLTETNPQQAFIIQKRTL